MSIINKPLNQIVVDYEMAIHNAIKSVISPDISIQGCFYHLTQATWRRIQADGLQRSRVGGISTRAGKPSCETSQDDCCHTVSSDWRDFVRINSMVTRLSASFSCRLESVSAWTIKHSECDIDCSDTSVFIQRLCPNVVYVLNVQCYDYYILVYL